jgi:hypothetical protein
MSTPISNLCADRFFARFEKLLSGEIVPGRNECFMPYDSPWEQDFQWVLAKHIPDFVTLRNQVPFGRYRVDYAFECSRTGRIWVVEFDGKTFHDKDRDNLRDEAIFTENPRIESIVRVDANTGHLEPLETQSMLSMLLPECFSRHYTPRHEWTEIDGIFRTRIFDQRHDEDGWITEEGHKPGSPMIHMKIQIKRRT